MVSYMHYMTIHTRPLSSRQLHVALFSMLSAEDLLFRGERGEPLFPVFESVKVGDVGSVVVVMLVRGHEELSDGLDVSGIWYVSMGTLT